MKRSRIPDSDERRYHKARKAAKMIELNDLISAKQNLYEPIKLEMDKLTKQIKEIKEEIKVINSEIAKPN